MRPMKVQIKQVFAAFASTKRKGRTDSGLTLIECLVAISVIALTSASVAPVLVLSVATRVQNQKSEQALQLAKGEIDRVRLLVERNQTYTSDDLDLAESAAAVLPSTTSTTSRGTAITTVGPPTSLAASTTWTGAGYTHSDLQAKEIDVDGDTTPDFVLQSFRGGAVMAPVAGGTTMPVAFDMGVRVYDYNGITDSSGALNSGLSTDSARLGFTSGEGQRSTRPLAVLYTQVINSDDSESLCEYMKYLRASVPSTMSCN